MALHLIERSSPNRDRRPDRTVDMLVLHYTGMRTAGEALARLCDPAAGVSAHYLIDEDGSVVRLVPEDLRAWHAGESCWQGRSRLNDVSIGIELVNPGHEWGYRPFTDAQIDACTALCREILARWPIPARRVLAHADIAPRRKEDPGELFPWRRLAEAGIGLWPKADGSGSGTPDEMQRWLQNFGYDLDLNGDKDAGIRAAVTAFQRHFRQERVDGEPDPETAGRLQALLAQIGASA